MSEFQDEGEGTWEPPEAWITTEGMLRCACQEWATKRTAQPHHCKHTDEMRKGRRLHVIAVGPYYFVNDKRITDRAVIGEAKTRDEALLNKFWRLVQYVSAVPAWERYMAAALIEQVRFPIESAVLLDQCSPSTKSTFIAAIDELHRLLMEGIPPEGPDGQEGQAIPSKS